MLRSVGVELDEAEVAELADRTEGWAAGTYLAALSLKDGRARPGHLTQRPRRRPIRGRLLRLRAPLPPGPEETSSFLTRTAVLDRMCGPLCDAMLESTGSASKLESLARANLFLVPLDRRREWYRYHREFRDFLRAELERREPELVPELNRRAAAWCEANG